VLIAHSTRLSPPVNTNSIVKLAIANRWHWYTLSSDRPMARDCATQFPLKTLRGGKVPNHRQRVGYFTKLYGAIKPGRNIA